MSSLFESGQTWVALGDSITFDPDGYFSRCAGVLSGIRCVNAGVGGDKARDMRRRLQNSVLDHHPDWVSISVGVNDAWHGFYDFVRDRALPEYDRSLGEPIEEYRTDLNAMIDAIQRIGAKVILVSPTMIGEIRETRENRFLESYVASMKETASARECVYCPMNESMWDGLAEMRSKQPDACITTDGVHMTARGAQMMADTFLTTIGKAEGH